MNAGSPLSGPLSGLVSRLEAALELLPRPLDRIRSMKLKLSIVLLGSGGVGIAYLWYRFRWLPSPAIIFVTVAMVLLTAQILAHGMTRPLREMTSAAATMAQGDYTVRVRATARDEVGQLAGAFNRMAADLAEADQRRRELIANVSHELRTPIAAMQAMLENAVDGITGAPEAGAPDVGAAGAGEPGTGAAGAGTPGVTGGGTPDIAGGGKPDVAAAALTQTERLARLVSDFLDLSRVDAGAQSLRRVSVPVRALLDEATTEVDLLAAGGPGPRFVVDVEPPDLMVLADRVRLRQVVGNLLDNAARHGPADGQVTALARAEGDRVVIEVRDEGPGIAVDDRHQMFERFTRGERAGGGGTGLGLAIARWVVDLHGGRIAVVDHPGVIGCAIRVTLPAGPESTLEAP